MKFSIFFFYFLAMVNASFADCPSKPEDWESFDLRTEEGRTLDTAVGAIEYYTKSKGGKLIVINPTKVSFEWPYNPLLEFLRGEATELKTFREYFSFYGVWEDKNILRDGYWASFDTWVMKFRYRERIAGCTYGNGTEKYGRAIVYSFSEDCERKREKTLWGISMIVNTQTNIMQLILDGETIWNFPNGLSGYGYQQNFRTCYR